MTLPEIQITW